MILTDPRDTDLFGKPVRARKGERGRPPKEMTSEDLDMLEAGLMKGWSQARLARTLGIGLSTLKRNFGPILRSGSEMPDRLQLLMFSLSVRKALSGDMGAVRQLRQMIAEDERRLASARIDLPVEEVDDEKEVIGKKERERRVGRAVAEDGGSDLWGGDLKPGGYH